MPVMTCTEKEASQQFLRRLMDFLTFSILWPIRKLLMLAFPCPQDLSLSVDPP